MKYHNIFIKQSEDWLHAHIYEHVVSNAFNNELRSLGYLRNVHYTSHAHVDDGILYIEVKSNVINVTKIFHSFIKEYKINNKDVKNAANQVAIEYRRELLYVKPGLVDDMEIINKLPWQYINEDFVTTQTVEWNMSHKRKNVAYGKNKSLVCDNYEIVFEIQKCPYQLKTLAVYLLQAVGLITCDIMYEKLGTCYNDGDMWAEYQKSAGYILNIAIPKSITINPEKLLSLQKNAISLVSKPENITELINFIKQDYNSEYSYFGLDNIYKYTSQIIGQKRLCNIATKQNIAQLFSMIECDVVKK